MLRRRLPAVLTTAATAVVLTAVPAAAQDEPPPRCVLPGGTIGVPEVEDHVTASLPPRAIPDPDAPAGLPDAVHLRGMTETSNRQYWFALHDGSLWFRPNLETTGVDGGWGRVPTPDCLDGRIVAISADDDELVALDARRTIHQLDQVLADPALWNWSTRWGNPFWTDQEGWDVPPGHTWDWSVVSNVEDETWLDPAGNHHRIGDGKVSHIWLLGEDQRTFTYLDPWLPKDLSYAMCGPHRGRFRAESMVSSGSTLFVVNRYGDLFTRVYDFDIAGADPVFFSYAYEDQRGVSDPDIQLPGAPWVVQPKVPGAITDRISITKSGTGVVHRSLRVEGRDADGRTGYWQKDVGDGSAHPWMNATSTQVDPVAPGAGDVWEFVRTDEPLRGTLLDNRPDHDLARATLGPSRDRAYGRGLDQRGALADGQWAASIPDFSLTCTPSTMRVEVADGEVVDLRWHVTDTIRQSPEEAGLTDDPRGARLAVEVPAALWERRDEQSPAVQAFLDQLDGRWTLTTIEASLDRIEVPDLDWTFTHVGGDATGDGCGTLAPACDALDALDTSLTPLDQLLAPLDAAGRDLEPLVIVLREAIAFTQHAIEDAVATNAGCEALAPAIEQLRDATADVAGATDALGELLGERSRTLRPAVDGADDVAELLEACTRTAAAPERPTPAPSPSGPPSGRDRSTPPSADRAPLPSTGGSAAGLGLALAAAAAGTRRRDGRHR